MLKKKRVDTYCVIYLSVHTHLQYTYLVKGYHEFTEVEFANYLSVFKIVIIQILDLNGEIIEMNMILHRTFRSVTKCIMNTPLPKPEPFNGKYSPIEGFNPNFIFLVISLL